MMGVVPSGGSGPCAMLVVLVPATVVVVATAVVVPTLTVVVVAPAVVVVVLVWLDDCGFVKPELAAGEGLPPPHAVNKVIGNEKKIDRKVFRMHTPDEWLETALNE